MGDCADGETVSGTDVPPPAQPATREATTCATNIVAAIRGGKQAMLAFEGLGTLGSLGHGCGVAQILGMKISGVVAWFLWRCIYVMKIPGLAPKFRISIDWFIHLIFPPDLAQTKVEQESGIKNQHFEPGDIIFNQGDLGDNVYVIQQGNCDVLPEVDAAQTVLATLHAGDVFGDWRRLSEATLHRSI